MTEVAKAEKVLTDLQRKREVAVRRGTELRDEQCALAYSAHGNGDAKAAKRLSEVNHALAVHGSEVRSIDIAIAEAKRRVEVARQAEQREADAERAEQLQARAKELRARGAAMDKSLTEFVKHAAELNALVDEIHALGSMAPTGQQFLTYGQRALVTAVMQCPWRRAVEMLPHGERRTFTGVCADWALAVERQAGDQAAPAAPAQAPTTAKDRAEAAAARREFEGTPMPAAGNSGFTVR